MKLLQLSLRSAFLMVLGALALESAPVRAATAAEIDADSHAALRDLYATHPKARVLGRHAYAILVFPSITKGGFIVAAQHGEGALFTERGILGYFRSLAASYGFQAGIQKFGYASSS
jgi:lipid-binding SYLF domain-containing protein